MTNPTATNLTTVNCISQVHSLKPVNNEDKLERIKHRISFIDKVTKDFSNNSLDQQVRVINITCAQNMGVNKNLVEIKTQNWINIGNMLIEHRKYVEKSGHVWTVWAFEHFPYLRKRRREMIMEAGTFGDRVFPYLYMGIDRLYDFFHKLITYQNHPDYKTVTAKFNIFRKDTPESEETKAMFNEKADMIREFFKFVGKITNKTYNRDLLLDVIETGVTFRENDYEELNKSKTQESFDLYLKNMLANGSSPSSQSTAPKANESLNSLLSKVIQTIRGYQASQNYPKVIAKSLVASSINLLTNLQKNIK